MESQKLPFTVIVELLAARHHQNAPAEATIIKAVRISAMTGVRHRGSGANNG